uniref:Ras-associating domain-containing protein n=1 Tax=Bursaphelenchus xylophilus TaxID=6326 RepID=A0A1I7RJH0_BURXY
MELDGRLRCGLLDRFVEAKGTTLFLSPVQEQHSDEVPLNHRFKKQRQKPGSGVLDVQCLHVGPTLVVRITDRADVNLEMPSESNRKRDSANRRTLTPRNDDTKTAKPSYSMEVRLEVPAGLGISVVNNQSEELIYALFKGLEFTVMKTDSTYQMTGSVSVIQIDNQLLYAEKWPVLYCEVNALKTEGETPESPGTFEPPAMRLTKPALKLEMSCNPRTHYDAFDVS